MLSSSLCWAISLSVKAGGDYPLPVGRGQLRKRLDELDHDVGITSSSPSDVSIDIGISHERHHQRRKWYCVETACCQCDSGSNFRARRCRTNTKHWSRASDSRLHVGRGSKDDSPGRECTNLDAVDRDTTSRRGSGSDIL